jgi:hypothetical protein
MRKIVKIKEFKQLNFRLNGIKLYFILCVGCSTKKLFGFKILAVAMSIVL